MNVTSAVSTALSAVQAESQYSVAVAGKAMDAQKQEGEAALQLISAATGKGRHVDARA